MPLAENMKMNTAYYRVCGSVGDLKCTGKAGEESYSLPLGECWVIIPTPSWACLAICYTLLSYPKVKSCSGDRRDCENSCWDLSPNISLFWIQLLSVLFQKVWEYFATQRTSTCSHSLSHLLRGSECLWGWWAALAMVGFTKHVEEAHLLFCSTHSRGLDWTSAEYDIPLHGCSLRDLLNLSHTSRMEEHQMIIWISESATIAPEEGVHSRPILCLSLPSWRLAAAFLFEERKTPYQDADKQVVWIEELFGKAKLVAVVEGGSGSCPRISSLLFIFNIKENEERWVKAEKESSSHVQGGSKVDRPDWWSNYKKLYLFFYPVLLLRKWSMHMVI